MRSGLLLAFEGFLALFVFLPKSLTDAPPLDSEFIYERIRYHLTADAWRVNEVPWHHDYPYSDETFPTILGELTNIKTSATSFQIIDIDSSYSQITESPSLIDLTRRMITAFLEDAKSEGQTQAVKNFRKQFRPTKARSRKR